MCSMLSRCSSSVGKPPSRVAGSTGSSASSSGSRPSAPTVIWVEPWYSETSPVTRTESPISTWEAVDGE